MPGSHGKALFFSLDNSTPAVKDISADVEEVDGLPGEVELAKYAGGGSSGYSHIPGLFNCEFTVKAVFNDTADKAWDVVKGYLADAATRSFVYGPKGSSNGYPKFSGECWIRSIALPGKTTDMNRFTATLVVDGVVTIGTF